MSNSLLNLLYTAKPENDELDLIITRKAIAEENETLLIKLASTVTINSEADRLLSNLKEVDIRQTWVIRKRSPEQLSKALKNEKRITVWAAFADSSLIENESLLNVLLSAPLKQDVLFRVLLVGARNNKLTSTTRTKLWETILRLLKTWNTSTSPTDKSLQEFKSALDNPKDTVFARVLLKDVTLMASAYDKDAILWSDSFHKSWLYMWNTVVKSIVSCEDETFIYDVLQHVTHLNRSWYTGTGRNVNNMVASAFVQLTQEHKDAIGPLFLQILNTLDPTHSHWVPLENVCNGRAIDYVEPDADKIAILEKILVGIPAATSTAQLQEYTQEAYRNHDYYEQKSNKILEKVIVALWLHPAQTSESLAVLFKEVSGLYRVFDNAPSARLFAVTDKNDTVRVKILIAEFIRTGVDFNWGIYENTPEVLTKLMAYVWEFLLRETYPRTQVLVVKSWLRSAFPAVSGNVATLVTVTWVTKHYSPYDATPADLDLLFPGLSAAPPVYWDRLLTIAPSFEGTTLELMETLTLLDT